MRNSITVQVPADPTLDPEVVRKYIVTNYNLTDADRVQITQVTGLHLFNAEITWNSR